MKTYLKHDTSTFFAYDVVKYTSLNKKIKRINVQKTNTYFSKINLSRVTIDIKT